MKDHYRTIIILNVLLLVYSLSGVCSKLAAGEAFLSGRFLLFYGIVLFLLAVYAVAWQQIIKRLPLTMAYANKAVSVLWAMVWGIIFFHEEISPGKIIGALLVVGGIVLFAFSDQQEVSKKEEGEEDQCP